MDLLRGQTLAERLDERSAPFSVGEVLEISWQLLDVLVHAHHRGIVHRDIKPQNVFLTTEGRVRLLDFGIARIESAKRTHATEAGTTLGTPAFMSPEQALGRWEELDGRSDLWSLGATMYLLLSGQPVREPGTVTEQLLSAMTRPAPSLGEVSALPRSVVTVVDRALAFDRDARYPDARSMQLASSRTFPSMHRSTRRTRSRSSISASIARARRACTGSTTPSATSASIASVSTTTSSAPTA
jgi:serine/threonine-protein kinase